MAEGLIGLFGYEEDFLETTARLREQGVPLSVMTPIPMHEVEQVLGIGKSKVRYFSLTGAIVGALSGFALAAGTALVFVLPTSGRPVIPIPPYLVITYEMTILFGVLATLLGFHVVSRLPAWHDAPYTPEVAVDKFGISVRADSGADLARVEALMREGGAEEIKRVEYDA